MIQESLSKRNSKRAFVPFRIVDITLVNSEGCECGLVSYVRLGQNEDTLDHVIFESIKQRYPLSSLAKNCFLTSQPANNFKQYAKPYRLYISVKNYTGNDPGYESDTIDSMLPIFLDVYNPTDSFVYNEIEYYSRMDKNTYSKVAQEIHANLETYNTFIM